MTVRLQRLSPVALAACAEVEDLDLVLTGSMPLPVCRSKRAGRGKAGAATLGYGTQGRVYGFQLHAWSTLSGKQAQCVIPSANQHGLVAGYDLNIEWVEYGAPRIIRAKAYLDGCNPTSQKKNVKAADPR